MGLPANGLVPGRKCGVDQHYPGLSKVVLFYEPSPACVEQVWDSTARTYPNAGRTYSNSHANADAHTDTNQDADAAPIPMKTIIIFSLAVIALLQPVTTPRLVLASSPGPVCIVPLENGRCYYTYLPIAKR